MTAVEYIVGEGFLSDDLMIRLVNDLNGVDQNKDHTSLSKGLITHREFLLDPNVREYLYSLLMFRKRIYRYHIDTGEQYFINNIDIENYEKSRVSYEILRKLSYYECWYLEEFPLDHKCNPANKYISLKREKKSLLKKIISRLKKRA